MSRVTKYNIRRNSANRKWQFVGLFACGCVFLFGVGKFIFEIHTRYYGIPALATLTSIQQYEGKYGVSYAATLEFSSDCCGYTIEKHTTPEYLSKHLIGSLVRIKYSKINNRVVYLEGAPDYSSTYFMYVGAGLPLIAYFSIFREFLAVKIRRKTKRKIKKVS